MLLDNALSHPSKEKLDSIDPQCEVIYLPPNNTSLIQPMDQVCITPMKKRYEKIEFVRLLCSSVENLEPAERNNVEKLVEKIAPQILLCTIFKCSR